MSTVLNFPHPADLGANVAWLQPAALGPSADFPAAAAAALFAARGRYEQMVGTAAGRQRLAEALTGKDFAKLSEPERAAILQVLAPLFKQVAAGQISPRLAVASADGGGPNALPVGVQGAFAKNQGDGVILLRSGLAGPDLALTAAHELGEAIGARAQTLLAAGTVAAGEIGGRLQRALDGTASSRDKPWLDSALYPGGASAIDENVARLDNHAVDVQTLAVPPKKGLPPGVTLTTKPSNSSGGVMAEVGFPGGRRFKLQLLVRDGHALPLIIDDPRTRDRWILIITNPPGAAGGLQCTYTPQTLAPGLKQAESVVLYNVLRSSFNSIDRGGKGLTRDDLQAFIGTAGFKALPANQQAIFRKYNSHVQGLSVPEWQDVAGKEGALSQTEIASKLTAFYPFTDPVYPPRMWLEVKLGNGQVQTLLSGSSLLAGYKPGTVVQLRVVEGTGPKPADKKYSAWVNYTWGSNFTFNATVPGRGTFTTSMINWGGLMSAKASKKAAAPTNYVNASTQLIQGYTVEYFDKALRKWRTMTSASRWTRGSIVSLRIGNAADPTERTGAVDFKWGEDNAPKRVGAWDVTVAKNGRVTCNIRGVPQWRRIGTGRNVPLEIDNRVPGSVAQFRMVGTASWTNLVDKSGTDATIARGQKVEFRLVSAQGGRVLARTRAMVWGDKPRTHRTKQGDSIHAISVLPTGAVKIRRLMQADPQPTRWSQTNVPGAVAYRNVLRLINEQQEAIGSVTDEDESESFTQSTIDAMRTFAQGLRQWGESSGQFATANRDNAFLQRLRSANDWGDLMNVVRVVDDHVCPARAAYVPATRTILLNENEFSETSPEFTGDLRRTVVHELLHTFQDHIEPEISAVINRMLPNVVDRIYEALRNNNLENVLDTLERRDRATGQYSRLADGRARTITQADLNSANPDDRLYYRRRAISELFANFISEGYPAFFAGRLPSIIRSTHNEQQGHEFVVHSMPDMLEFLRAHFPGSQLISGRWSQPISAISPEAFTNLVNTDPSVRLLIAPGRQVPVFAAYVARLGPDAIRNKLIMWISLMTGMTQGGARPAPPPPPPPPPSGAAVLAAVWPLAVPATRQRDLPRNADVRDVPVVTRLSRAASEAMQESVAEGVGGLKDFVVKNPGTTAAIGVGIGALVAVQFVPGVDVAVDGILGIVGAVAYGMQVGKTIKNISDAMTGFKTFLEKGFGAKTGADLNAARDGFKRFIKNMGAEAFKLLALLGDIFAVGKAALGAAKILQHVREVFRGEKIVEFGVATMNKLKMVSEKIKTSWAQAVRGVGETVAHTWKNVSSWFRKTTDWAHHLFVNERRATASGTQLGRSSLAQKMLDRIHAVIRNFGIHANSGERVKSARATATGVSRALEISLTKLKVS